MLKHLLQGRPLGHPLHVMLVHLPIGLLLLSFVFDVASLAAGPQWVRPAFWTMSLGVATALLAAIPGLADYSDIRRDHPARKIATWHMLLNVAAVALYAVNLVLRWRLDDGYGQPRAAILPVALSLVGVAILSVSGYLGGVMVYDDGIGVGRHRREGKIPHETIRRRGDAGAWVEIGDDASLAEGQSLRAEVNGVVMAIARSGGRLYAFQEFCTHRYGPLSEGALCGDQVKCPWHGSCFDISSGAVTHGPAKEPIRVFGVEVREGKVMVRAPTDGD
jgi:nitrite reductase/ring-hydroxylating ferredoxin subunit/uncharacterized membrane protein